MNDEVSKKSKSGRFSAVILALLVVALLLVSLWWQGDIGVLPQINANINSVAKPTVEVISTDTDKNNENAGAIVDENNPPEAEILPEAKGNEVNLESLSIEMAALKKEMSDLKASIDNVASNQDDNNFLRLQALWRLENRLRHGLAYASELNAFEQLMSYKISKEKIALMQLDANTGAATAASLRQNFIKMAPDIIAMSNGSAGWLHKIIKVRPVADATADDEIERAVMTLDKLLAVESYSQAVVAAEQIKSILTAHYEEKTYGDYIAWLEKLKHIAAIWQALDEAQQSLLQEKL